MRTATTALSTQREPELLGQTVVVIGGSSGIGLVIEWMTSVAITTGLRRLKEKCHCAHRGRDEADRI